MWLWGACARGVGVSVRCISPRGAGACGAHLHPPTPPAFPPLALVEHPPYPRPHPTPQCPSPPRARTPTRLDALSLALSSMVAAGVRAGGPADVGWRVAVGRDGRGAVRQPPRVPAWPAALFVPGSRGSGGAGVPRQHNHTDCSECLPTLLDSLAEGTGLFPRCVRRCALGELEGLPCRRRAEPGPPAVKLMNALSKTCLVALENNPGLFTNSIVQRDKILSVYGEYTILCIYMYVHKIL